MQLKVLGSNSQGNCYILENSNEALLIECGVKMPAIKAGIDYKLSKISGCLVSHEHKDHCIAVNEVLAAGIKVYATPGTAAAMGVKDHHRYNPVTCGKNYQIGSFKVMAFETKHDAAEPCCFLIQHEETGTVLFLTDTYYVEYRFRGLNNIIIEANYCQTIIDEKMATGKYPDLLRNRVLKSHMSIATCKQMLRANDLTAVNHIVLIHLSDSNSDATRFRNEVAAATGKQVTIADKGLIIEDFNKIPVC